MIDSHVNLHGDSYADDLDAVLERARGAGVSGMLAICDKWDSRAAVLDIARAHPAIWASVGAHPHYAKDHRFLTADDLIGAAADDKIIGIGEAGIDFHYNYSPAEDQIPVFLAHVEAARQTGLPLIIHARNCDVVMEQILQEQQKIGRFSFVLHCYTSELALAKTGLALGGYISFSGIVSFKAADAVRAVCLETPLDRLLIETDCPYLAPVPLRGRRNEPAFVAHVAAFIAQLRGLSVEALTAQTDENFFRLFTRAKRVETVAETARG